MLLSLLLHALVLLGLAPQFSPAEFSVPPTTILRGELLPGPSPVSKVSNEVAVAPAAPVQREMPPVPVLATPPSPVRETRVASTQKPQPDPAPMQPLAANAVPHAGHFIQPAPTFANPPMSNKTPATANDTSGGSVSRTTTGPTTVAVAREPSDRGANAAGLRQFRLALASEARRFRRYPEAARRDGLAGTAEVRVTVDTGLPVRRVDLSRSSGYAVLDTAAVEMLRQAITRVELPESLRGQSFAVALPVVFEVEE